MHGLSRYRLFRRRSGRGCALCSIHFHVVSINECLNGRPQHRFDRETVRLPSLTLLNYLQSAPKHVPNGENQILNQWYQKCGVVCGCCNQERIGTKNENQNEWDGRVDVEESHCFLKDRTCHTPRSLGRGTVSQKKVGVHQQRWNKR